MSTAAATPAPKPLVQLISRFSLVDALNEGAPAGAVAYLEKLAEVLEDVFWSQPKPTRSRK